MSQTAQQTGQLQTVLGPLQFPLSFPRLHLALSRTPLSLFFSLQLSVFPGTLSGSSWGYLFSTAQLSQPLCEKTTVITVLTWGQQSPSKMKQRHGEPIGEQSLQPASRLRLPPSSGVKRESRCPTYETIYIKAYSHQAPHEVFPTTTAG